MAAKKASRGKRIWSKPATHAESPSPPKITTNSGVKQQIAVIIVPAIPNFRICFMASLVRWLNHSAQIPAAEDVKMEVRDFLATVVPGVCQDTVTRLV